MNSTFDEFIKDNTIRHDCYLTITILMVSQKGPSIVEFVTFYECIWYLVFSVWLFNKLVYQHIFETKH